MAEFKDILKQELSGRSGIGGAVFDGDHDNSSPPHWRWTSGPAP